MWSHMSFWGNEIVPEEPKPKSKRKKRTVADDWKELWAANDMDDWFNKIDLNHWKKLLTFVKG
jgi:hypothetical protein